ncbi:caldesmon-like [Rhopilema esculentum]|uniref:caldesmon-like n=1 Tax=Rhopilema esculentum TaxID=499914 RepID=UPI0031D209CA
MLGRLEAEKQRLLKEKIEEKERKAVDKKERLKRRKERKAARQTRRTERAKANAAEKEKQVCVNAEEALKEKMRAAEGKKAEIMLERESKRNIHRFKQIRAELIKLNETGTKDRSTLEDRNENILGQGRQEAMRCKTALDKVYALLEQSAEEEVNLETFDGDSNNVFAEEPEITEITKDPFWDC